jgi:aryl-alcohol dehydrogenase-like predicted oxidoreductase
MEYRNLGRTGVKVSKFCLGTMMFGRITSEEDSIPIIEYALEQGVNFIDTANVYAAGKSEIIVGKVLSKAGRRQRTILATKGFFPMEQDDPNARGLSRRNIMDACEQSLKRLQTDWIDLYQLHRPQADVPIDETLRALDDLIRAGKVRYIGTSMFPGWRMVEALWVARELGLNRFVCEREVIPAAMSYGMAVIPWAPLCGGLLSGKYRRHDTSAEGRWQGGKDNKGREVNENAFNVIEELITLAGQIGCTPSQLALAWNAAQPGITAPIIGPRTLEQCIDNLGASDVNIDGAMLEKIDGIAPPLSTTLTYYEAALGIELRPNSQHW